MVKNIVIIVLVLALLFIIIWRVVLKKPCPFGIIDKPGNQYGPQGQMGPTGSPCDPNVQLARPPAGKTWTCSSGQWILVNEKI